MVILIAWLIPLAISLSLFVGMYATNSRTAWKVLRLTGVSAFDIVSCVLLFYAVVRILVAARKQSNQVFEIELQLQSNVSSTEAVTSRRRRIPNTARLIIALVVFFLGCYVIVNISVLCETFSCEVSGEKAGHVLICLLVLNSAVNPMVYALLKRDIKREISLFISHMSILRRPCLKPNVIVQPGRRAEPSQLNSAQRQRAKAETNGQHGKRELLTLLPSHLASQSQSAPHTCSCMHPPKINQPPS